MPPSLPDGLALAAVHRMILGAVKGLDARDRARASAPQRLDPVGSLLLKASQRLGDPYELMPVGKIVRWTLTEALRGRPGLILAFLRQGRRASGVQRELATCRSLLNEVRERR